MKMSFFSSLFGFPLLITSLSRDRPIEKRSSRKILCVYPEEDSSRSKLAKTIVNRSSISNWSRRWFDSHPLAHRSKSKFLETRRFDPNLYFWTARWGWGLNDKIVRTLCRPRIYQERYQNDYILKQRALGHCLPSTVHPLHPPPIFHKKIFFSKFLPRERSRNRHIIIFLI